MAAIASQVVLHPAVSNSLKVASTTVGRDKAYRAVQYLARFLAWHTANRSYSKETVAQWTALKSTLAASRKLMRVGKWAEHLQAFLRLSNEQDPILRLTSMGRQAGYAIYLFLDSLIWLHISKIKTFQITTYDRIYRRANQAWAAGVAFSIISGVYSRRVLSARMNRARVTASSPEKESESRAELSAVRAKYNSVNFQLTQDLLDIWIPATMVGYTNFSEGTLGIFGLITSLMGLKTQAENVLGKKIA